MAEWVCENCNAIVDEGFDVCWQCGTSCDGEADPEFSHERDAATLPPGTVRNIRCRNCGYKGSVLVSRHRYSAWEYIVGALLSLTMLGVAPVAIYLHITKFLYRHLCPKCRHSNALEDWDGAAVAANEELASAAQAEEIARFSRQYVQFLCVVLGALVLVGTLLYVGIFLDR